MSSYAHPIKIMVTVLVLIEVLTCVQKPKQENGVLSRLLNTFLPAGYPHSVTSVGSTISFILLPDLYREHSVMPIEALLSVP